MAAFRMAAEAGSDMIELDVRLTLDGELVVHHDRRIGRTTDGRGKICNKTLQQIRRLDAGSWFSSLFAGERVPTLREVLDWLPERLGLNIEVKTDGDRRRGLGLEKLCAVLLKETGIRRKILVTSFDHLFLGRLHHVDPLLSTGVLYGSIRDAGKLPSALARRVGASAFICSRSQLRKRFVDDAHEHRLDVYCYGVNSTAHLAMAQRLGVDAVITDYPDRIIHAVQEG